MIVFSGHIANWEIGMLAGVQHGISVAQIYRALNNPLVDRIIARFRGDSGEFIPKGAIAARRAIAAGLNVMLSTYAREMLAKLRREVMGRLHPTGRI